jgi:hypothetical protein
MKNFNIEESEKKRILNLHKSLLKEQVSDTQTKTIDVQLQELIDSGCFKKEISSVVSMSSTNPPNKQWAIKINSTKTPNKSRYYFIDNTIGEKENGKFRMLSDTWPPCDKTPQVNQQQLTPQQQKSVNQLVNDGGYTTTEPTADEIGKKEFTKVLITKIPGFGDFPKNYYIWEKTGKRQVKSPQQVNAIKTYTDAGWQDIGGKVNPAEADKYDTIDLIDIYPDDFKESYKLVKPIESVDTNELIEELNTLVGTKNFGDRKTCRNIISKYNLAKQKDAPINAAVLLNWKIAVNACNTKVSNFNDLDSTKSILRTLTSPPKDKKGNDIKDNDIPVSDKDKKWAINIRKKETPKENQPAAGATQPVSPTAGAPTN